MEKTSAPGTTVWLHLRPTAGDLIDGEAIQTSFRALCPLALLQNEGIVALSQVSATGSNPGSKPCGFRPGPQTPAAIVVLARDSLHQLLSREGG